MKALCICQYGHSRSVALTRVLHGRGTPAVAVGWGTSGDAIGALSAWADRIVLLEPQFIAHVPSEHRGKALVYDVGPDRWVNPYHPELGAILLRMHEESEARGEWK